MLKVKDNVDLTELEKFGFEKEDYPIFQRNRSYALWNGVVKIWVDRNRILHFNAPRMKEIDLVFKMNDILEYTEKEKDDLRFYQKGDLVKEVQRLREKVKELEEKNE